MGDAGARLHRAHALMQAGRSDAAAAEVETALAANPENVRAWALRAVISEANGDAEEARGSLAKVSALGRAGLGLAKGLMRAGRFDEAGTALEEHLADHPEDAVAWNQRGVSLAKQGLGREAVEALRKAASFEPHDAGILNNLAVALAAIGRVDEAVKRIAAARRMTEDPRILLNEAALRERKGTPVAAREAYTRVLEVAPEHPEAVAGKRRLAPKARPSKPKPKSKSGGVAKPRQTKKTAKRRTPAKKAAPSRRGTRRR